MNKSRRQFIAGTVASTILLPAAFGAEADKPSTAGTPPKTFTLHPIGVVEKSEQENVLRLRIFDEFKDGLLGLDGWSHVLVFYWFDKNDTPRHRRILQVRPQGNKENPLTGVFACRAPFRPNLIALTVCKLRSVEGNVVNLDGLDAFEGTPILDLKPFTPPDAPAHDTVRVPAWARGGPGGR